MIASLVVLAMFQQQPSAPAAPKPATLAPSPIAKLAITPGSKVTMTAGDTLRLRVAALDAAGKPVENVTYKYFPAGGYFEGKVDSTGLISSGSTGGMGVSRQLKNEITDCPPIVVAVRRRDDRWLATWSQADAVLVHPLDPITAAETVARVLRESARASSTLAARG